MNSFLTGKKTLAIPALRPPLGLVPAPAQASLRPTARAAASGPAEASVEVVKEGDKVVRLVITCTCGERVEVECLYPVGS